MGDKGYCTEQDFVFATQMAPNQHWSESDGQQTFYRVVEEGKLEEFGPGKYRLVEG